MVMLLGAATLVLYFVSVAPAFDRKRWPFALDLSAQGLVWGALTIILLYQWMGPYVTAILIVGVMVHEYGHVLAMRLAGHRAPVFRLAPFGGVAFSGESARNHTEAVYIALMGPGFTLALVVAMLLVSHGLRETQPFIASVAQLGAMITALINLFNLLPLFPLDGGRAMRAILSAIGPGIAPVVSLATAAALAALATLTRDLFLILIAGIGILFAARGFADADRLPPMKTDRAFLCAAAYAAVALAHGAVAAPLILSWVR